MSARGCIFCTLHDDFHERIITENGSWYAVFDLNPVSPGHTLIVARRHVESFFQLTEREVLGMYQLLEVRKIFTDEDHAPDGYNIGINEGEAAGRTVHHLHVHLIPRYAGDMENPRGGVRGVIPGKADYPASS